MTGEPVRTTCPYCGVGCGLRVESQTGWPSGDKPLLVGDPEHPANHGRLCSKGAALAETLDLDDRLLYPEVDGRRVDWDTALDTVAAGFRRIIDRHGPDAVAFYVSGQLLTEDYYVANKLMKGFIGSANIDTNSRLCMSSAVVAQQRAFGADAVPVCYEDLEQADLVLLVGSNLAWAHPVLYQRLAQAKRDRPQQRLVVIDPRRTASCELADLHLPLKPGSDTLLFNGLLTHLQREGKLDWRFLEQHVGGFGEALEMAHTRAASIPEIARRCELDPAAVAELFRWFAECERTVTLFSQGINQSSSGVDKANSIINLHLATGRIGRPGTGPFSVTGQPNAMGGREVGGLASQLAAHMSFDDPAAIERVARFWSAPRIAERPGLKAVELFQAVAEGRVKALWIMATNPAYSLPEADRVRASLAGCEFLVVSDCVRTNDTLAHARVRLPAAAWGEKDGTVTNSERCISRQRAFLPTAGESRPDWWIVTQVARRLGFESAFDYHSPAEIFREHARLSAFENHGRRAFDIGALVEADYESLQPVQWPVTADAPHGTAGLFADGRFFTPDGRARLIPVTPQPPATATDPDYPLILNTGRLRDQWHSMTRTAKTARLTAHVPEPLVQVHPRDAACHGVIDGELARLDSPQGELLARVAVTPDQRPGSVFVPIHWSGQFASHGRVDALVAAVTDPLSGQPEFKHCPVRLRPYVPRWHGFLLANEPLAFAHRPDYWVVVRAEGCWRYELAGDAVPENWNVWLRALLDESGGEWLEFADPARSAYRAACLRDERLRAVLFVAPRAVLPTRGGLQSLFGEPLSAAARRSLLSGRLAPGQVDAGPTVCACFGIGRNTLLDGIRRQGLASVDAVGDALGAGSGCGSCRPEIRVLLEQVGKTLAA